MAVRGTVSVKFDLIETGTGDLVTPTALLQRVTEYAFTDGAGANQVNLAFSDTRTITASSNEDLDLAGVLAGALGGTLTYARIKLLYVKAAAGNTNNVNVTRPATLGVPLFLAASDGIALAPGAAFLWVAPTAAGVAVTASTADIINIANSAGSTSVTYDVIILGASS